VSWASTAAVIKAFARLAEWDYFMAFRQFIHERILRFIGRHLAAIVVLEHTCEFAARHGFQSASHVQTHMHNFGFHRSSKALVANLSSQPTAYGGG